MRHRQKIHRVIRTTNLVILAGLPQNNCATVAKSIEYGLTPSPRVIFQPSSSEDGALYRVGTVSGLLKATSQYAVRQQRAHTPEPAPGQVLLAYVPANDDEKLLLEFDFTVFPVRLTRLAEYNLRGRQYRHDTKSAIDYVIDSIKNATTIFSEIKRRLSSPNFREPLLLPPRNFQVTKATVIADLFLELRRDKRSWVVPFLEVHTSRVSHEELNHHIPGGVHKDVLTDYRTLLYPHDLSNHGPSRELPENCTDEERKWFLRSSFRFGVPLQQGYHHDVQYGNRKLGGTVFNCCDRGELPLNCKYANVYPNDCIRPSKE
jgi:hypothetical protein